MPSKAMSSKFNAGEEWGEKKEEEKKNNIDGRTLLLEGFFRYSDST